MGRVQSASIASIVAVVMSVTAAGCASGSVSDAEGPEEVANAELVEFSGVLIPDPNSFAVRNDADQYPDPNTYVEWERALQDASGMSLQKVFKPVENFERGVFLFDGIPPYGTAMVAWVGSDEGTSSSTPMQIAMEGVSLFGGEASSIGETEFTTEGGLNAALVNATITDGDAGSPRDFPACVVAASAGDILVVAIAYPSGLNAPDELASALEGDDPPLIDADCSGYVVGFANRVELLGEASN